MSAVPRMQYPKAQVFELLTNTSATRFYLPLSGDFLCRFSSLLAPTNEEIHSMLLELRSHLRWSRGYLSAILGVSKITLQSWELKRRVPTDAARKLIWLVHSMMLHPEILKTHREIISWGKELGSGDMAALQANLEAIAPLEGEASSPGVLHSPA